ncbi:MAG: hypothetical protein CL581_05250 [Alteromonadaceae bacterium]|nr:hypothetical protein [Alteromonadaceae bacterium]
MQPAPNPRNTDELRIFGLISFVSILVGAAISVFDARLWLYDDSTYTNAITYTMGAFTLQGMAYFIYKMLAQDGMDQKAMLSNMQRNMSRQMQEQQMRFAQAQMNMEIKKQEVAFAKQMEMLEEDPEVQQYLSLMGIEEENAPQHKAQEKKALNLGGGDTRKRNADGTYAKKKE